MARLPRLYMEGCPQHIIQRGNNRQASFFADEDYTFYFDRLETNEGVYHLLNSMVDPLGVHLI